jgi:hypothetical protein
MLLRQRHQNHWGVLVAIAQRRAPLNTSKSVDPNESYGNTIVLTLLKNALTTIALMLLRACGCRNALLI